MKKLTYLFLLIITITSCKQKIEIKEVIKTEIVRDTIYITERKTDTVFIQQDIKQNITQTDFYIIERLPNWFLKTKILQNPTFEYNYKYDNRLNPMYFEDDFNGDGNIDIAIPIKEINSQKSGFAIIHGNTNKLYIIGAGKKIKNGLSDDMFYIDIWKINRKRNNAPGLDQNGKINKKGPLKLKNPALQIEKSEVGGGLIYWNGNDYVYFHQTC